MNRAERYRQKMNFIITKLESIPASRKTNIEVNATLYCVQVAIDAAMGIIAMLVKDIGHDVSDDYHNINILVKEKVISEVIGEDLRRFNGLRNAIVHKYNAFEEESVLKHVPTIKNSLEKFLNNVETKLNAIIKKNKK